MSLPMRMRADECDGDETFEAEFTMWCEAPESKKRVEVSLTGTDAASAEGGTAVEM